jgi:hypothetical protein
MKICGALLCAFIILNTFCFFYFNFIVSYQTSSHATDFAGEPNTFYSIGKEGFASGRTDKHGYTNYQSYDTVDGLIMGSSHMESQYVNPRDHVATRLNSKYGDSLHFYNIGAAGHDFLRCVRNAHDAIVKFQPQRYLFIETSSVDYDYDSMNSVLNGTYPYITAHSKANKTIVFLRRYFPFIRWLHGQTASIRDMTQVDDLEGGGNSTALEDQGNYAVTSNEYNSALSNILDLLVESADGKDVVIFLHKNIELNNNGDMISVTDKNKLRDFERLCEDHGITFIDMSDDFIAAYNNEKIVPYGFSNTIPGEGHLNKYGHEIIAERLSRTIDEMENEKSE